MQEGWDMTRVFSFFFNFSRNMTWSLQEENEDRK